MIRVVTLDRHPAVHAGVAAVLHGEPDLVHVGAAADRFELWPLLDRTHPDVVLVDDAPGGLELCLRITRRASAPRVVLYTAGRSADAIVPAMLAGVDAIVAKTAPVRELLETIRRAARDGASLPALPPQVQSRAARRLESEDRAIFAMRLAGTAPAEIAETLGIRRSELGGRITAILSRLSPAWA